MKLARRPARQLPETIVPLIDVVFFLLVFFMLVGRMDATSPFEVTPPTAETGSDMPGGGTTIAIGADGSAALNGVSISRSNLRLRVRTLLENDLALFIRVNAHHTTELRNVLPLVAELEALGAKDVALVVTPEDSQR